jgi:hypothetical protein
MGLRESAGRQLRIEHADAFVDDNDGYVAVQTPGPRYASPSLLASIRLTRLP